MPIATRHEHRRHPVGEALDLGAAPLCLVDETHDLGQRRVGAHPCRLHDERSVRIHGGTDHLVARTDLDRHGLTGDHRCVDGGVSVDDHPVGRDLLARADDELHTGRQRLDRHLGPVDESGTAYTQVGERSQRIARAPFGPDLQPLADEDQRDDDRRRLVVDVSAVSAHSLHRMCGRRFVADAAEQHDRRPRPCRQRSHRDERVHGGGAVAQVHPCGAVESPTAPEHDRRREDRGDPFPTVEHQRRHHRDGDDGNAENERDDPSTPKIGLTALFGLVVVSRHRRLVAESFDGGAELIVLDGGVVHHGGAAVGEVDPRVGDTVELGQRALDAVRARGTGHPLDGDVGTCRRLTHVDHRRPSIRLEGQAPSWRFPSTFRRTCDDLTAVGIGAGRRVQSACATGEVEQFGAGHLEPRDLFVDLREVPIEQGHRVAATPRPASFSSSTDWISASDRPDDCASRMNRRRSTASSPYSRYPDGVLTGSASRWIDS